MMASHSTGLMLALDVPTREEALAVAGLVREHVSHVKVGLRLFTSEGPDLVRALTSEGQRVFLDLKFHDIPNTVADAAAAATALGVDFFTVHIAGGAAMLHAARDASLETAVRLGTRAPVILGVTVLTSLPSAAGEVLARARAAVEAGIGGLVASAREVGALREALGDEPVIVTPGVRPSGADRGDQERVATPAEAARAGADYVVVGRPIWRADNPAAAARAIVREMRKAEARP